MAGKAYTVMKGGKEIGTYKTLAAAKKVAEEVDGEVFPSPTTAQAKLEEMIRAHFLRAKAQLRADGKAQSDREGARWRRRIPPLFPDVCP